MIRFSANISILFNEVPFLARPALAARCGFGAVEFWWPPADAIDSIEDALLVSQLEVSLINFNAGDMAAGDRGLLSDPQRMAGFRNNVPIALDLAQRIGCRKLNALVGKQLPDLTREEQLDLARTNIAWAADLAAERDATILIEAVNTFENGPYLLSRTDQAAEFVHSVGRPNVLVQYDAYHMQRMEGNLAATLARHIKEIGYIQIADSPGRGEPGTGEINFDYLFRQIDELGYHGYVGLEYRPSSGLTEESLRWLAREARGSDGADASEVMARTRKLA